MAIEPHFGYDFRFSVPLTINYRSKISIATHILHGLEKFGFAHGKTFPNQITKGEDNAISRHSILLPSVAVVATTFTRNIAVHGRRSSRLCNNENEFQTDTLTSLFLLFSTKVYTHSTTGPSSYNYPYSFGVFAN